MLNVIVQKSDILPWKFRIYSKGKIYPITCHEGTEGEYSSTVHLASALYGDVRSTPRSSRFTPGNISVPTV
jgi:hypothetical protein